MNRYWLGKKRSNVDKEKMRKSALSPDRIRIAINNLPKNVCGKNNPFFGKKHSSKFSERMSGMNHPYWKGGAPSCIDCGKKLKSYSSKRCRKCYSTFNIGERNHKWKGGYENKLMLNRQRRILKMGNGGSHTLGEWEVLKVQYNFTCPSCKKSEPEIKLTEDHIIPLSKGGSDNIENIQPLCRSCNSSKNKNIIKYET